MSFSKLLFVTQFEELWFDSLQSLLNLRRAGLNHVVFINVIPRERVSMRRGAGYQKQEEIKLREKANIRFIDWAETLFEQGMEVGVYIGVGGVAQQVTAAVDKEAADLVVLGRPKKGMLERLLTGSDITEILQRASVPVLVCKSVRQEGRAPEAPFERPLLVVDWSPASDRAVDLLSALKGVVQAVNVIHVVEEKRLKGDSAMAVQKVRKQKRRELDAVCDVLEAAGIPARAHVYIGEQLTEIEKAALECQATMIVIGSSSRSVWKERWVGSTPDSLAQKSAFSTLIVPVPRP